MCSRLRLTATPPLRPASRASPESNSWAVPFACAALPPLLAISRCLLRSIDANPRLLRVRAAPDPLAPLPPVAVVRSSLPLFGIPTPPECVAFAPASFFPATVDRFSANGLPLAAPSLGYRVKGPFGSKKSSSARLYSPTMSLTVHLLGTSASRPTVERNVASVAVHREGETLMFDCGEGTQRQMMRYGISFSLQGIFFTHMHADHLLGVIGLIRTMALQGRTDVLRLWGPKGTARVLRRVESLGFERATFPVEILEINDGQSIDRTGYAIRAFGVDHRGAMSLGFAIV